MEWLAPLLSAGENAKLTSSHIDHMVTYKEGPGEEGEPHPLGGYEPSD